MPTAAGTNREVIMQSVLNVALTATWHTTPAATKTRLLPFPAQIGATPHLTVRAPQFKGWGRLEDFRPTSGIQYARLKSGTGRIFTWAMDVITLYDYTPDAAGDTVVANAESDLWGPTGLEVTFQENPQIKDSNGNIVLASASVQDQESCSATRYGISLAGRALWMTRLVVIGFERQPVDYS